MKSLVPFVLPADPTAPLEAATKQYVDNLASNEVWVGTSDPIATNPSIELWVDTDDPGALTDDTRWNTAWGEIASVVGTDEISVAGSGNTLVTSLNFTAREGRRYQATFHGVAGINVGDGVTLHLTMKLDGVGTSLAGFRQDGSKAGAQQWTINMERTFTTTAGSHSIQIVWNFPNSAGYIFSLQGPWEPWSISVVDVGPVTGSVPAPNPTPAWQLVTTFTNGWRNRASNFTAVRYRMVGDDVQIEGSMEAGTMDQPAFTLPAGFRPPKDMYFPATAWATDAASVGQPNTVVGATGVVTPSSGQNVFWHLGRIQFSVTP